MLPKDLLDDLEKGDRRMEMLEEPVAEPTESTLNQLGTLMFNQQALQQNAFGQQNALMQNQQPGAVWVTNNTSGAWGGNTWER